MTDATLIVGPNGEITTEGMDPAELEFLLGPSTEVNCARPLEVQKVDLTEHRESHGGIRVHSIYHGSVVEGPGVRSVLQLQGCFWGCPGCYVPETHNFAGGVPMNVNQAIKLLLDPTQEKDGITIHGGEPLAQQESVLCVLESARSQGINTCLYTGWTLERLVRIASKRAYGTLSRILRVTDLLIDGRYEAGLSDHAGEWVGSRNQRKIYRPWEALNDTAQTGVLVSASSKGGVLE